MGIFDFITSGVRELAIARPDDKKQLIVYKHPDRTIPKYAQLTVDADEAAGDGRETGVVGDDEQDREGAESLHVGTVPHRCGLGSGGEHAPHGRTGAAPGAWGCSPGRPGLHEQRRTRPGL